MGDGVRPASEVGWGVESRHLIVPPLDCMCSIDEGLERGTDCLIQIMDDAFLEATFRSEVGYLKRLITLKLMAVTPSRSFGNSKGRL